ncbi:UNVERIFIED_CONTAM: hypothetical protein FKN15_042091 [Acipenser sinensis]
MDAQGRKRQDRQYNRHHRTRLLPAVIPGQKVWITMEQTPRSYLVETKKGLFRHLRPTDQSTSDAPSPVRQVNPSREANILPFAKQLRAASLLADEYLGFADKHLICYREPDLTQVTAPSSELALEPEIPAPSNSDQALMEQCRSVFRPTQTSTPQPFLAFLDFLEEVKSSWQYPASVTSVSKSAAVLASMEGAEAVGLAQFPPVDTTVAALVRAPPQ